MPSPVIYLDMDGVLANWTKGCCVVHGRPDLVKRCEEGTYPKDWEMEGEFGDVNSEDLWWPIDLAGEYFWSSLEMLPWAPKIVETLEAIGIPWYICAHTRHTPSAYSGKVMWLQELLGNGFKNIIMTPHKHLLAHENALLIDDSQTNCERFVEAGGKVFIFPQPHNENAGTSRLVGLRIAITEAFGAEVFNVRV